MGLKRIRANVVRASTPEAEQNAIATKTSETEGSSNASDKEVIENSEKSLLQERMESLVSDERWQGNIENGKIEFGEKHRGGDISNISVGPNGDPVAAATEFFNKLTAGMNVEDLGNRYQAVFPNGTIVTLRLKTKSGLPSVEINRKYSTDKGEWLDELFKKIHFKK